MGEKSKIVRHDGAVWNTVKFECPKCGHDEFELHMIDDEQHYVMRCAKRLTFIDNETESIEERASVPCWQAEKYFHIPSDVDADDWPYEPASDDTQTVDVLVPVNDDGNTIAEVADFRGKDCDVVIPEVAKSLGDVREER